ncbi:MAG: HAD family hydrolase [Bacteroidota bacterium]|nr:HAD family hydrolase [Bacteroidota bacterium]
MKNKAVFLDRDGVVNREIGDYVRRLEDFRLNNGVLKSIKLLKSEGYKVIIVSNQGGISKGLYTKDQIDCMHDLLIEQVRRFGADIDEIYVCPHHSSIEKCLCRKPSGLMLEKAIARFDIDKSRAVFIGDAERDVEAANRAGVRGIKIDRNSNIFPVVKQIIHGRVN